jgi:hypothetical protein
VAGVGAIGHPDHGVYRATGWPGVGNGMVVQTLECRPPPPPIAQKVECGRRRCVREHTLHFQHLTSPCRTSYREIDIYCPGPVLKPPIPRIVVTQHKAR